MILMLVDLWENHVTTLSRLRVSSSAGVMVVCPWYHGSETVRSIHDTFVIETIEGIGYLNIQLDGHRRLVGLCMRM